MTTCLINCECAIHDFLRYSQENLRKNRFFSIVFHSSGYFRCGVRIILHVNWSSSFPDRFFVESREHICYVFQPEQAKYLCTKLDTYFKL